MLQPGTRIEDRYEVLGVLGSGGMGHVYRARRVRLGDEVAIKVMHATPDAPSDLHERFLRESRACALLRHPSIVVILDFGLDASKQPYMVMELLSGPSLAEEITIDAPMPADRVAEVMTAVASALDLAHERGITHRDLKPANIVSHRYQTGERVYKVIDFGLAAMKAASDDTRLTSPDLFLGTMAYAAPEQVKGDAITPAADVYALGVIAYETPAREGLVVDEGVILEIVRPGTGDPVPEGEVGEVVVTTFNRDYPLIRFGTGDLSAVLAGASPCGRTNARIRGWMGRADQTTKVRAMFVTPKQVSEVVRRHKEVLRARLVVAGETGSDRMTLRCEVRERPGGLAEAIVGSIRDVTKLRGEVELVAPGSLPNDGKVIEDARTYS